jgi:hypothetical protein
MGQVHTIFFILKKCNSQKNSRFYTFISIAIKDDGGNIVIDFNRDIAVTENKAVKIKFPK